MIIPIKISITRATITSPKTAAASIFYSRVKMQGRQNFASNKWKHTNYDELLQLKLSTINLLETRGYVIPPEELMFKWTDYATQYREVLEMFKSHYEQRKMKTTGEVSFRHAMSNIYYHSENVGKKIFIRFISPLSGVHITHDQIRLLILQMNAEGPFDEVFLVSSHNLAPKAGNDLRTEGFSNVRFVLDFQIFIIPEEFFLTSTHVVMTEQETSEFYKKNNLSPSKMPQMTKDDPIAVRNGWVPGRLIKITRENTFTNGVSTMSIFYRVVSQNEATPKAKGKR